MKRVIFTFLLVMYSFFVYHSGYSLGYVNRAREDNGQGLTGPEGYCLADKPPHPGECRE